MPPASSTAVLRAGEAQWIFSEQDLQRTPSGLDGLPLEKELENRGKGVNFIIQLGILLKLPQTTLTVASVYMHRFYMRYTMVDKPGKPGMHYYTMAATSLFLATKVEETTRNMKELVIACCRVAQKNSSLLIDESDKEYWRWRDTILLTEDILLEAVCFDLTVESPYKLLLDALVFLRQGNNKSLRNAAWAFLNDSNLTMLCLLFTARIIAAASIYCAAKHCEVAFPDQDGKAWWEILGVDLKQIRRACNYMASVYEGSPLRFSENVYVRTPEDGDPYNARTRAHSSIPGTPNPLSTTDARSVSGSETSHSKRMRSKSIDDEVRQPAAKETRNGQMENGRHHRDDDDSRSVKRPRNDGPSNSQEQRQTANAGNGEDPELSEEGEVEA